MPCPGVFPAVFFFVHNFMCFQCHVFIKVGLRGAGQCDEGMVLSAVTCGVLQHYSFPLLKHALLAGRHSYTPCAGHVLLTFIFCPLCPFAGGNLPSTLHPSSLLRGKPQDR